MRQAAEEPDELESEWLRTNESVEVVSDFEMFSEQLRRVIAVEDLKKTSEVWDRLASERELVITRDGRPAALMVRVTPETVEESLREIRRARFSGAVNRMRRRAEKEGMPDDAAIAAEIGRSRMEGD